jgi:hypothetical protein
MRVIGAMTILFLSLREPNFNEDSSVFNACVFMFWMISISHRASASSPSYGDLNCHVRVQSSISLLKAPGVGSTGPEIR